MNKNLKLGGIIVSTLLIVGCGFRMMQLPLWEWWSFGLQVGLWAFVLFVFEQKYNPRWLVLSSLSGVLLVLGFPPMPFTLPIFIGFVPLFLAVYEMFIKQNAAKNAHLIVRDPPLTEGELKADLKPNLFRYVFNTFIIWNIGATWWVANSGAEQGVFVGMIAGLIANYLNAVFMAVPFILAYKVMRLLRGGLARFEFNFLNFGFLFPIVFIPFWLAFELLHLNWEISWPWLTLGNALADKTYLIQWYDLTGTLGGSLWILIINALAFNAYDFYKINAHISNRIKIVGLSVLILPILISVAQYLNWSNHLATGKTAEVVAVQPNYEPIREKFNIDESIQMPKYFRLSASKLDSTVDYLIYPETSFDLRNVDEWTSNGKIFDLQNFVNQYPKLNLVLGVDALKIHAQYATKKPDNLPPSTREFANRDGSVTYWEAFNAATQISAVDSQQATGGSLKLPFYKKSKLVPGPEILPYGSLLAFLKPLFRQFGGTVGGLGYQSERGVFVNQDGTKKVAPVICYESIYGDFCRGYVKNGAQALFVVTNDGWWGNTFGYRQHRAYARLRAIELRRSVVRSANTGSSCFINLRGDVEQATDYSVDAAIRSTIALNDAQTIYARLGDVIGWLAAILVGVLSVLAVFFRVKFGK